jgi:hypothetical protein
MTTGSMGGKKNLARELSGLQRKRRGYRSPTREDTLVKLQQTTTRSILDMHPGETRGGGSPIDADPRK